MASSYELAIEIPSKTFIIGEYLALNGTASMILATEPTFFAKVLDDKKDDFHKDSPAGQLQQELGQDKVGFSFFDPHEGRGGFGRSTAEYLSVYMYELAVNKGIGNASEAILNNLDEIVPQYQKSCGSAYKASGADLVAQVCGGLCWYDGMNHFAEKLAWPFPGYDIFIFHTGRKLATHEHLMNLEPPDLRSLIPILIASRTAIEQANLKVFCESLNYYYDVLQEKDLSDKGVYESVLNLRRNPEVLAAKGCGAMGVDTVIVVGQKSDQKRIEEICLQENFQFVSTLGNSHSGACVRRPM